MIVPFSDKEIVWLHKCQDELEQEELDASCDQNNNNYYLDEDD